MKALRLVMVVQGVALLLYAAPYLLAPSFTQSITGQLPVAEPLFLQALGVTFLVLGVAELTAARMTPLSSGLAWAFFLSPLLFALLIGGNMLMGGVTGAGWYWWLQIIVSAAFAVAHLVARRLP